jgi:hypothetical protein
MRISDLKPSVLPPTPTITPSAVPSPVSAAAPSGNFPRYYLVHLRKSAGSSLNHMFLSLADPEHEAFRKALADKPDHRLERKGKAFVGWNEEWINSSQYFYAFSHSPLYRLKMLPDTFVMTVFRDPVRRVVSYFNYLTGMIRNGIEHPCLVEEGPYVKGGFEPFIESIPPQHLMSQLYMFSPTYDVGDAMTRIRRLNHIFFTEKFAAGVESLKLKTQLPLPTLRENVSKHSALISPKLLERLRLKLEPEYRLLKEVAGTIDDKSLLPDYLLR